MALPKEVTFTYISSHKYKTSLDPKLKMEHCEFPSGTTAWMSFYFESDAIKLTELTVM